jgi:hypothetical protein
MTDPDQFATIPDRSQLDMFGAPPAQSYDPDPADVRAELNDLLAQARAAKVLPWSPARAALLRSIFPQMANWLPEPEARQLRFDFEAELKRLEAA